MGDGKASKRGKVVKHVCSFKKSDWLIFRVTECPWCQNGLNKIFCFKE